MVVAIDKRSIEEHCQHVIGHVHTFSHEYLAVTKAELEIFYNSEQALPGKPLHDE